MRWRRGRRLRHAHRLLRAQRGARRARCSSRFAKETGIEMEVRYGDTAELAATILEEGDSPADFFFSQDAGALGALEKAGLLAPLPRRTARRGRCAYRSARRQWVGTSGARPRDRLRHRDRRGPELAGSILELTDERWRGQIGVGAHQRLLPGVRHRAAPGRGRGRPREDWLEGMKANEPQVYAEQRADPRRGRTPASSTSGSSTTTTSLQASRGRGAHDVSRRGCTSRRGDAGGARERRGRRASSRAAQAGGRRAPARRVPARRRGAAVLRRRRQGVSGRGGRRGGLGACRRWTRSSSRDLDLGDLDDLQRDARADRSPGSL